MNTAIVSSSQSKTHTIVAKGLPVTVKVASRTAVATEDALDLMTQILNHIKTTPATAKQIAKAIKADKHAVNSLLYKALKPKLVSMTKPEGTMAPLWKAQCFKQLEDEELELEEEAEEEEDDE